VSSGIGTKKGQGNEGELNENVLGRVCGTFTELLATNFSVRVAI